jgi:hypothetical protein
MAARNLPWGRLLLAAVVLLGGLRVWDAARLRRAPGVAPPPPASASVGEPGDLGRARARDRRAGAPVGAPAPRDPFRFSAPAPQTPPPSAPDYAIPRAALVGGGDEVERVVLSFGGSSTRPLAPGESERGWTCLSIQGSKVLVENDGVIYTLPLP